MLFCEYLSIKLATFRSYAISIVIILCVLTQQSVLAQSTDTHAYVINNYQIDLTLEQSGQLHVHEKIDLTFNQERRGIIRDIPRKVKYGTQTRHVKLTDVHVDDYNYQVLKEGNNHLIRIGKSDKYITGNHSYHLDYTLSNICGFYDNHIELNYNLISNWDAPIQNVQYQITVPEGLDIGFNDFVISTGATGTDNRDATIEKDKNTFYGKSLQALSPKENITLAIKLPAGAIERPPTQPTLTEKSKFWYIPFALVSFLVGWFQYFKSKNKSIAALEIQQYPPENFNPAESGFLLDRKVHTRDIIALIPYWATLGYLKMELPESRSGTNEIVIQKLKDIHPDAHQYEKIFFNKIFESGDFVVFSDLKYKLASTLHIVKAGVVKSLIPDRIYNEAQFKTFHSGRMLALGGVFIILALVCFFVLGWILTGIGLIICAIVSFFIHALTPQFSQKGAELQNHMKGLQMFLDPNNDADLSNLIKADPDYFNKVYPYAIALGYDQSLLQRLATEDVQMPIWFSAPHHGRAMSVMKENISVSSIKKVFESVPPSSSGGSRSGGFSSSSGGGFGGGGRSW